MTVWNPLLYTLLPVCMYAENWNQTMHECSNSPYKQKHHSRHYYFALVPKQSAWHKQECTNAWTYMCSCGNIVPIIYVHRKLINMITIACIANCEMHTCIHECMHECMHACTFCYHIQFTASAWLALSRELIRQIIFSWTKTAWKKLVHLHDIKN